MKEELRNEQERGGGNSRNRKIWRSLVDASLSAYMLDGGENDMIMNAVECILELLS